MEVTKGAVTSKSDIAIIGAGPHALTLVTNLLQKRKHMRGNFVVFDPSGEWMSQWKHLFAALEIPHLRSPAVHHPAPDPYALRRFAEKRPHELYPPYDLPGTQLFEDFCLQLIRDWQLLDCVIPEKVTRIEPPWRRKWFRLYLSNGRSHLARRVVLATGGGLAHIPDWAEQIQCRTSSSYPQERLCHAYQIDLRRLQLNGERVWIVGGGLTSGHLALGALARGAKVTLIARRHLQEKLFDADPGWLGPKYLKGFWAERDWAKRWQLIQTARNGGSMTPAMLTQLRRLSRSGNLTLLEGYQIVASEWRGNCWRVICNTGIEYECDRIWLSTGTRLDVTTEPLLADILDAYPITIINNLPVLDEHLRWAGCELFIMGGLAALQIGPVARNLSGARMACERIVPALTKPSLALSPL